MDHKPLEMLGHLHTKILNRLQTALLEHNFVVQYKRGTKMPADYLSCLPSFDVTKADPIPAFDSFQPNLKQHQLQDQGLQAIFQFLKDSTWLLHLTKRQMNSLLVLAQKVFWTKTILLGFI